MQVALPEIWLAVLIATLSVFFASAIMWMLLPHHKADIKFLDDEADLKDLVKSKSIKPGLYMFPNCADHKDFKTDEFQDRLKAGPWGVLNVLPKQPNFGMNLLKTFTVFLVITIMVAYITGLAVGPGAEYMRVFRIAATTAILGHCMGGLCGAFFLGKPTRFIITDFIDGVVYALITAGILASMWPVAQSALDGMLIPPGT